MISYVLFAHEEVSLAETEGKKKSKEKHLMSQNSKNKSFRQLKCLCTRFCIIKLFKKVMHYPNLECLCVFTSKIFPILFL